MPGSKEFMARLAGLSELQQIACLMAEIDRLTDIIDTPDPRNFVEATDFEARYQRAKWSEDERPTAYGMHDDADYVFLVAHLTGGAAKTPDGAPGSDLRKKKLHRITAAAAALANWHEEVKYREGFDPHQEYDPKD